MPYGGDEGSAWDTLVLVTPDLLHPKRIVPYLNTYL